jgi:hypothetical protein
MPLKQQVVLVSESPCSARDASDSSLVVLAKPEISAEVNVLLGRGMAASNLTAVPGPGRVPPRAGRPYNSRNRDKKIVCVSGRITLLPCGFASENGFCQKWFVFYKSSFAFLPTKEWRQL